MKKNKLVRLGMRIGALMLSVCLLASMEGMDVRATGVNETVAQAEMNVDMEEVETLVDSVEIDVIEATTPETQVPILTEKDKYYKPYEDATYELWYYENEDSIEIKGIRGTDSGKLLIPDKIEGKVVNKIGDYAFSSCSGFTGILDIPNTIEYIGKNAFSSCSGLTGDLFIPKSVEILSDFAFKGCTGFEGKLTISEGVTSIGYMTFSRCRGLKGDLVIPKGVTSIGAEAFYECSGLEGDLIIGEGVTSIGKNAFRYSGFKGTLTLPESLVTVETTGVRGCWIYRRFDHSR